MIKVTETQLKKCPAVVHISITKKCNLNCRECYYKGEENPELVKKIIEDVAASRVKAVAIGGGEPMLHPNISDFINFLVESGKIVSITTNGTICKPIDGVSKYAISFDPIHEQTWKNPESVIAATKTYSDCAEVWLNHILTTKEDLIRALDIFANYATTVTLLALKPIQKINKGLWIDSIDLVNQYGFRVAIDACVSEILSLGWCRQGITSMSIDTNGTCAICSNDKKNRVMYEGIEKSWIKIRRTCPFSLKK
jgi:organic radical activating enzyme